MTDTERAQRFRGIRDWPQCVPEAAHAPLFLDDSWGSGDSPRVLLLLPTPPLAIPHEPSPRIDFHNDMPMYNFP